MFVSAAAWPQPLPSGFALARKIQDTQAGAYESRRLRSQSEKDTACKASHTQRIRASRRKLNKSFQEVRILAEIRRYD
jgi:hypothetical protein